MNRESVGREDLIQCCGEEGVSEPPNKPDPFHELLFCQLGLCRIGWKMIPRRFMGSDSFSVAESLVTM